MNLALPGTALAVEHFVSLTVIFPKHFGIVPPPCVLADEKSAL